MIDAESGGGWFIGTGFIGVAAVGPGAAGPGWLSIAAGRDVGASSQYIQNKFLSNVSFVLLIGSER